MKNNRSFEFPARIRKLEQEPMPRLAPAPRINHDRIPERKKHENWPAVLESLPAQSTSGQEHIAEQLRRASLALRSCIETNARKLGGVPVLKGTRFSVAQVLSQIADGDSVDDLAENFELNGDQIRTLLHALAAYLDQPVYK